MLARLSRMASIGPSQEDPLYLPEVIAALDQPAAGPEGGGRAPPHHRPRRGTGRKDLQAWTGRTVRNRLSRADKKLKTLKEDL